MPLSPRTQAMMAPEQGGDPEELFEQAFQDLALNQLVSQLPDIADRVISLKMLELSPDDNHAVGTFIIMQGNDEIHLPVVMSDNELMPFDTMYVKSLDMMLPLTPEWLEELDRKDVESMGDAQEPPEGLRTDEDIRNLVVPPTTGRYSYASAVPLGQILPEYLKRASNQVKTAFVQTLEMHPHIAKRAFEIYGVDTIKDAVRPYQKPEEKTANAELHVQFMTIETPTSEIKSVFGENASEAMRDIALKGYTTADQRPDVGELVSTERPLYLEAPGSSGFYRIFCSNGEQKSCMIFNQVLQLDSSGDEMRLVSCAPYSDRGQYNEQSRLGVTAGGEMFMADVEFLAEALEPSEVAPELASYCSSPRQGTPRNGQRGFFYDPSSRNMAALEPMQIDMVTNRDGKRMIYARRYKDGHTVAIVQIEGSPISSPKIFKGTRGTRGQYVSSYVPSEFQTAAEKASKKFEKYTSTTILVPWHYKFVPINSVMPESMILRNADAITAIFHDALTASGAPTVEIKAAGAGMLWVDGEQLTQFDALKKIAIDYNVTADSAAEAVKLAEHKGRSSFFAVNPTILRAFQQRIKEAQDPAAQQQPQQGAPPSASMQGPGTQQVPMGMDPAMMGMDPAMMQAMMGPPPPPPPSPVELAAQEVAQAITDEQESIMQELQSQQESLQKQMATIQMVMERAEQIAGEMGMDPTTGQPMTPDMMAPPGAAPMPVEEPGMMEQAMQFEDPEMFDAAAVASLASSNDYDVSVGQFMPVMREALNGIGRLLVEFRMKAGELKATIGDEMYTTIRDRLESLFEEYGATLIQLGNLTTAEEPSPM